MKLFYVPKYVDLFYRKRIWRLKNNNAVYLTFDDGPDAKCTKWLLNWAKSEKLKLNFFWLGHLVEKHTDLLDLAKSEKHFIGNHGYQHLNAYAVKKSDYIENFKQSKTFFPNNAFRPPYGKLSRSLAHILSKETNVVMWSIMSYDYDLTVSNEKILDKIEKKIKPGCILVFHEHEVLHQRLKVLMPAVLKIIKSKNLKTELLPF